MFERFRKKEESDDPVDYQIESVLSAMDEEGPTSAEYQELIEKLSELYKLQARKRRQPVSSDTLAIIAGNLAGLLLIVAYEQKHVISSKGFGMILRPAIRAATS